MRVLSAGAVCLLFCFICVPLVGSVWTDYWTEYPTDPIYNPEPNGIAEDYFPTVLYDKDRFGGHGDAHAYKMWHQGLDTTPGNGGLAYSYSNDGISWTLGGQLVFPAPTVGYHPCVVYDPEAFGEPGGYCYKMWFWTGVAGLDATVIKFTKSTDGINWIAPVPVAQDPAAELAVGVSGQWFYRLYGPGTVSYNPEATSEPGKPTTFPYVMYFDTATEGMGPGTSVEQIGLAYSVDGLFWTRFGAQPILIPSGNGTDWDASHISSGAAIRTADNGYHLFYTGSNELINAGTTLFFAHGIGHAYSIDGVTWQVDPGNPIFIYSDGIAWRAGRVCYAKPCIVDGSVKLWFSGGTGRVAGAHQGIGYATMPYPPTSPTNFIGVIKTNRFLNRSACQLHMTWVGRCGTPEYRIFKDGKLIATISAGAGLSYDLPVSCVNRSQADGYEIAAVNSAGAESTRTPLVMARG